MSDSMLDQFLQRQRLEQEQLDTLKEERLRLATRVALGDADARTRHDELEPQITEKQQSLALLARAVEGRKLELAQLRQQEQSAALAAQEERRRAARVDHQAALEARDAVAIDELEAWLADGLELFRRGQAVGRQLDTAKGKVEAGDGRPYGGGSQHVETPKTMVLRTHAFLVQQINQLVPGLGLLFMSGPTPSAGTVQPLSRPLATVLPARPRADILPREFTFAGPHTYSQPLDPAPTDRPRVLMVTRLDPTSGEQAPA